MRLIVILLGLLGTGLATAYLLAGRTTSEINAENVMPSTCDIVDNKQLKPIEEVRFFASHSDRFSRIHDIGLTDQLQTACDTLLGQGFTLRDTTSALVPIGDIGNPSDDRAGRYTRMVQLEGVAANPFSGRLSETAITLFASSPATYSGVELLISRITYDQPLSVQLWQKELSDYFGAPSHLRYDVLPIWVIAQDTIQSDNPTELCDPALARYDAAWWEIVPEIDERANIPVHDGRNCSVLIMADVIPSEDQEAPVGGTMLTMIDYTSISQNRRAENALVQSLRYPTD